MRFSDLNLIHVLFDIIYIIKKKLKQNHIKLDWPSTHYMQINTFKYIIKHSNEFLNVSRNSY